MGARSNSSGRLSASDMLGLERNEKEQWKMWLPSNIIAEVDAVARIYYINVTETKRWNEHKSADELRMLTGWCWTSKRGDRHSYGFKTITVAYRDAWYALVQKSETPVVSRVRLVKGKVA